MDLRSRQVYADILRDDSYKPGETLSARDTYGLPKSPMFVYNPYASELDQLDKTLFLERRMRIQENIINRHKTEAERVNDKDKNKAKSETRHGKKTYTGMFNDKQSSNEKGGGAWVPKEAPVNIQGNVIDYPIVETLDTARGKARYALVRINSTGSNRMYVESVHSIPNTDQVSQSGYNTQKMINSQLVDPNKFIGPEYQEILEKVNGKAEYRSFNIQGSETSGDKQGKKSLKKNLKITLDDLNEEELKKNPLTSRKTKQSLKPSSKDNDMDKIGRQDLENRRESRNPSRDTNQTGSRKGSLVYGRQSTLSWSKHSQATGTTGTPLSLNSGSLSPIQKRGRNKKLRKIEGIQNSNVSAVDETDGKKIMNKNDNSQAPPIQPNDPKTSVKERPKGSNKALKSSETKNTNVEGRQTPTKPPKRTTKESSPKGGKTQNTQDIVKNKHKSMDSGNTSKSNDKKGYAAKHRGLRKTDSFKMMGSSSHFFGYISAEEEEVKKPKSILKKSKSNPDRPDTA